MLNYNHDLSPDSKWAISENINKMLPFYVTELGSFKCGSHYFTERDNMQSHLLIVTVSGEGRLNTGGKTISLTANSAVLIDCSEYHKYETVGNSWEFIWMHIDGSGVKSFCHLLNTNSCCKINMNFHSDIMRNLEYIELLSSRSDILSSVQISNTLSDILSALLTLHLSNQLKNTPVSSHYKDINTVIEYIRSNYENNINLDDMTALVNISKYHFIRLFKEQIGTTPYEYMLNYRMLQAKRLLRSTHMSINEISIKVGFFSASNFIQKFKALEGISPAVYRKETLFYNNESD